MDLQELRCSLLVVVFVMFLCLLINIVMKMTNSIEPYQTWLWGSKQFDMMFAILRFNLILYQRVRINRKCGWLCFPLHNAHKSSNLQLALLTQSRQFTPQASDVDVALMLVLQLQDFQDNKNEKAPLDHVQKQICCNHYQMEKYSLQSFPVNILYKSNNANKISIL